MGNSSTQRIPFAGGKISGGKTTIIYESEQAKNTKIKPEK